jgi:small subunit ribosomal protein S18
MAGRKTSKFKKKKKFRKFNERARIKVGRSKAEELYDYKNVPLLKRLCTQQGKLFSRKRAGNTAWAQRRLQQEIKRARFLALLPYVG